MQLKMLRAHKKGDEAMGQNWRHRLHQWTPLSPCIRISGGLLFSCCSGCCSVMIREGALGWEGPVKCCNERKICIL